jgi:glycosyltransferase involved in cell wall biosynthesis
MELIDEFSPDLVHVWGTECNWGLLTGRNMLNFPVLLEMQGLRGIISQVFDGGLTFQEQLACIGLKEILRGASIGRRSKQFKDWGLIDQEIIKSHQLISCHSDWMLAHVRAINKIARIFRNEPMVRKIFFEKYPWKYSGNPVLFCSVAYPLPFKGLHIAIRSLAILKQRIPKIHLRIAGSIQRSGFRQEGYIGWINREISRLHLQEDITWLGPLSAQEIVDEISNCSAFVLPTYIESYCVTLAEAMVLGAPTVVTFNGGTSFLASDNETALFFPPGDEVMCAYQIERLMINRSLAESISNKAREIAVVRNDPDKVTQRQVKIYQSVMTEES